MNNMWLQSPLPVMLLLASLAVINPSLLVAVDIAEPHDRDPGIIRFGITDDRESGAMGLQRPDHAEHQPVRSHGDGSSLRIHNGTGTGSRPLKAADYANTRLKAGNFPYAQTRDDRYTDSSARVGINRQHRHDSDRPWQQRDINHRDGHRHKHVHIHYYQPPRHSHVINWYIPLTYGGLRFYYSDGAYYRHNGFGLTLVKDNVGTFLYSLPYGYRTLTVRNYPYFYANKHYYIRDRVRKVYLQVDDPYMNAGAGITEYKEMFVYPAAGQSVQQTEQDKYECHLWAVDQTGYDPSLGKPGDIQDYRRAQSACLEGRGYVVN